MPHTGESLIAGIQSWFHTQSRPFQETPWVLASTKGTRTPSGITRAAIVAVGLFRDHASGMISTRKLMSTAARALRAPG